MCMQINYSVFLKYLLSASTRGLSHVRAAYQRMRWPRVYSMPSARCARAPLSQNIALTSNDGNTTQHPANPAKNLARAGLGRISEKRPDSGFAGAEVRYNAIVFTLSSEHCYNYKTVVCLCGLQGTAGTWRTSAACGTSAKKPSNITNMSTSHQQNTFIGRSRPISS